MSMVKPEELWALWNKGEVMPEHVMGQVIQVLMAHERLMADHGTDLVRHQQQLTRLEKAQMKLKKLFDALKRAFDRE